MAFREIFRMSVTSKGLMRDALRRCQMFHTFPPRLERLRPDVIPLRSRKVAKSSEDKQGRHFVDNCRVRVKVIFDQGDSLIWQHSELFSTERCFITIVIQALQMG